MIGLSPVSGGIGGRAYVGGTLSANPLSCVAGYHALLEMERLDAPAVAGRAGRPPAGAAPPPAPPPPPAPRPPPPPPPPPWLAEPRAAPSTSDAAGMSKGTFTYEQLAAATGGFAEENLVGQGGFGYVHKGVLAGGKAVAVKQLKSGSGQGEREFQAEVDIISRVHHRHLVSLVGYCADAGERLLVYEFLPRGSLDAHLFGRRPQEPPLALGWAARVRIAVGAARGLRYLHEVVTPPVIYRDLKASNILLDDDLNPRLSDFGLAKLGPVGDDTHVSTRVMGTYGYCAPEYAMTGKLTTCSDVYSFGVVGRWGTWTRSTTGCST